MAYARRCLLVGAVSLAFVCLVRADPWYKIASSFGTVWEVGYPDATFYQDQETLNFAELHQVYPYDSTGEGYAYFDLAQMPDNAVTCTLSFRYTKMPDGCNSLEIDSAGVFSTSPGNLHDFFWALQGKKVADTSPLPANTQLMKLHIPPARLAKANNFVLSWLTHHGDIEVEGRGAIKTQNPYPTLTLLLLTRLSPADQYYEMRGWTFDTPHSDARPRLVGPLSETYKRVGLSKHWAAGATPSPAAGREVAMRVGESRDETGVSQANTLPVAWFASSGSSAYVPGVAIAGRLPKENP